MVDQSRALADQLVTGAVERLQVLLVRRFDRNQAHCRTHRRFEDRLRVDRIVLRALDEGLYETRVDEAHLAAGGEPASTPVMRAGACLHRDAVGARSPTTSASFARPTFLDKITPSVSMP